MFRYDMTITLPAVSVRVREPMCIKHHNSLNIKIQKKIRLKIPLKDTAKDTPGRDATINPKGEFPPAWDPEFPF